MACRRRRSHGTLCGRAAQSRRSAMHACFARWPRLSFWVAVTALECSPAAAQCTNVWSVGAGTPGTNGSVYASTMWDPDGAGPLGPRLVIGGVFTAAGDAPVQNLAMWDPVAGTWTDVGGGVAGVAFPPPAVHSLAVLSSGALVVGGYFTSAGGVQAGGIAQYDGTAWSSVGGSTDGAVLAMRVLANGDLLAGGVFFHAGGVAAQRIARWNGTTWASLGLGLDHYVLALVEMPNGDLVAGGTFFQRVKRWDGTTWSPVGAGVLDSVNALAVLPNGDLVAAGGLMAPVPGGNAVARWNGTSWV